MAWGCNWMGFKIHSNSSHSVIKDAPLLHEHAGQKSHWDNSNLHMESCRICKYLCKTEERELHILMSYIIRSLTHAHRKVHAGLAIIFFFYIVLDLSLDQTQLLIDLVPDTRSLHSCHSQITQASSIEWIWQLHLCRDMGCGRCHKGKEAHQNLYSSPGLIQIFLRAWGERKREKKKKKSQQKNPNSCEFIDSPLRISGAVNSTFMVLAN